MRFAISVLTCILIARADDMGVLRKMAVKDGGKTAVLGPGGYGMLPSKHVHQFTCASACSAFVISDAAFDIHYVDAGGAEISPDAALSKKK